MKTQNNDEEEELDYMAKKFLGEIRSATSEKLASTSFAKTVAQLSDMDYATSMQNLFKDKENKTSELEKEEIVKGIIRTSWLQRIHSTMRSLLLGLVTAAILIPTLLYFGSLTMVQNVLLFFPITITGLVVTRVLDKQTIKASKKVVRYLSKRRRLRNFLMNYI
ncbi:MAG: hypothetical protein ACOWW1_00990 [archaeon]